MADEKPKHKPSPKRTLEEVLKSLQDLIRNDLVSRRDADPTSPPRPPSPPALSEPDAFDHALDRLDELINHELVEPATHTRETVPVEPEEIMPGEAEWPPEESAEAADGEPFAPPAPADEQVPSEPHASAHGDRADSESLRFGIQDRLPFEEPPPSLASFLKDEPCEEPKTAPAVPPERAGPPAPDEQPASAVTEREPEPDSPREAAARAESRVPDLPDDGIPVLHEVVSELASGHELATPEQAREIAIRVVARLNIERRKAGEPPLDIRTIERLQKLLREALARDEPPTGG